MARTYEVRVGIVLRYRIEADAAIDVRRYVEGPGRASLEDDLGDEDEEPTPRRASAKTDKGGKKSKLEEDDEDEDEDEDEDDDIEDDLPF